VNEAWHRAHILAARADFEERLDWHVAHAKACGCREMPRPMADAARHRGLLP